MRGQSGTRRVTAADVARAAGVSAATVSLVVNGKDTGRVLPETRRRVLDSARQLGYEVDRRARSLATGRSGIVGFVYSGLLNPFFAEVQLGLLERFGERIQMLSVGTEVGHATARGNISAMFAFGVDGVIVDPIAHESLGARPTGPVVLLDSPGGPADRVRVGFDLRTGAEALADHLLGLGHRSFGYLDSPFGTATYQLRRQALEERVRSAGGTVSTATSHLTVEAVRERTLRQWPSWHAQGVTAIVCASDVMAYGALEALRTLQVPVPEGVALASFDDLPTSHLLAPALTCVRLPALELGRRAATAFLDLLAGDTTPHEVVLPTELIVRASTGRPLTP
ncbi:LacI family DNA-binding transcriptional regulator [Streptomyces liangshanensis]|uniref:LacI family DNA-binding transcriptional regulator n=1 Tax=Streptomyces liangshanensis TaxID=2717324 RepID=UPI0036D9AF67